MTSGIIIPTQQPPVAYESHIRQSYVWRIAVTAAFGGLLFGYDLVVIGGAKPFYESYFRISDPALIGWCISSALVGCIIGAPLAGIAGERAGRRPALMLAAILFGVSSAGVALSETVFSFVSYRILGGVGIGLAASIAPIYIAEISPASQRGRMVGVYQLMVVIGILSAQIANLTIAQPTEAGLTANQQWSTWNVQIGWRVMFGALLVPILGFASLLMFVPESPRWLLLTGREKRARQILTNMASSVYADAVITDVRATRDEGSSESVDLRALFQGATPRLVMIGTILAAYQQWSGINIIFNYATDIFISLGFSVDGALRAIVATGGVSLIATIFALRWVETIGRRPLLLFGSGSLAILMLLIGLLQWIGVGGFIALGLILAAIFSYSLTIGPIVWVFLAEIFPGRIRSLAMGICTLVLWIASFLLSFSYPFLLESIGTFGGFLLYGAISAAAFGFIYTHVRETGGRSLEQIEALYEGNANSRQGLR